MFQDAWGITEGFQPIDRVDPLTLELKLRILTALEKWELGEPLARVVLFSDIKRDKCRQTVARFHHGYARAS